MRKDIKARNRPKPGICHSRLEGAASYFPVRMNFLILQGRILTYFTENSFQSIS